MWAFRAGTGHADGRAPAVGRRGAHPGQGGPRCGHRRHRGGRPRTGWRRRRRPGRGRSHCGARAADVPAGTAPLN